jgi:hypothetical protein
MSSEDTASNLTGLDIYHFILDRYNTNQSGSYDLGFVMYQDMVITQVLRGLGIEVSRLLCSMLSNDNPTHTSTHNVCALEIEGNLIDANGDVTWGQIIKRKKRVYPWEEDVSRRTFSEITQEQDVSALSGLDASKRLAILNWINRERAFIESWALDHQTATVSSHSRCARL